MKQRMNTTLSEMKKELNAILSSDPVLKQAVREVNKLDIIRGCLISRNSKHQEMKIDRILAGDLLRDASIGDYMFVQKCAEVLKVVYNNLEMGNSVDRNMLTSAYRILSENPKGTIRSENPVVYAFNHVPPHSSDIDGRLTEALRKIYSAPEGTDVIACAMFMHNSIIDIWPYDEFNSELAVLAANYYLMEQGLMPIDMPMGRQDYLDLVSECLKGRKTDEEYRFFAEAVMGKMVSTIEVCRGYLR